VNTNPTKKLTTWIRISKRGRINLMKKMRQENLRRRIQFPIVHKVAGKKPS